LDFFTGKPDPVKDCVVTNKTFTSIFVECVSGYDGGLKQSFVIAVFPQNVYDEFMKKATTPGKVFIYHLSLLKMIAFYLSTD
jgi:hypothetical protein